MLAGGVVFRVGMGDWGTRPHIHLHTASGIQLLVEGGGKYHSSVTKLSLAGRNTNTAKKGSVFYVHAILSIKKHKKLKQQANHKPTTGQGPTCTSHIQHSNQKRYP